MPKVRFQPLIEEIRGTFYDVVFKRSPQGKPIVTKRPDMSNVEWSEAQRAQRQRFREANAYARAAMADPAVRRVYETMAVAQKKPPYRLAMADYFQGRDLLSR